MTRNPTVATSIVQADHEYGSPRIEEDDEVAEEVAGDDRPPGARDASPRERRLFAAGVVAIAVLAALVRLRFLDVPLSVDEGGYAAVARFWASGSRLYRDVWADRPQGLLLLYRGAFDVFGVHAWSVRALATVWGAGLAAVVALLVARVAGHRTGLVAGLLVALLSVGPRIEGFAANGELLAALPAAAAILCFAVWLDRRRDGLLLAAGALAAFALLVKQSGYDGGGAIVVWLVLAAWRGWLPRRVALRAIGLVALGAAVPIALSVAHGVATGFDRYWFSVAGYRLSVESVATGSFANRMHLLWDAFASSWPCVTPLIVLAPFGIAEAWRSRRGALLVAWGAFSITGFLLGGLFHPHYFVGLIAPFCALAALGLQRLARDRSVRVATATAVVLLAVPAIAAWPVISASSPSEVSWRTSHDGRILTDKTVGAWLRARTRPGQTVYAMYAEASIYFAADRPPAFKYLWFLGEQRIPHALRDLRNVLAGPHAPRYIVVYQPPRSMPGAVVAGIPAVLRSRYRDVTRVDGHDVLELKR
jgi:4-amino-4-deoxy-L-arabinose transferase-like glycosyltransferase